MQRIFIPLATAFVLCLTTNVNAQFTIDLEIEARSTQFFLDDSPQYLLFPRINVQEGGVATDASVLLISPNNRFRGRTTGPDAIPFSTSDEAINEANGTWSVRIEDSGNTYVYDVDVDFTPPFTHLPFFSSSTLINGNTLGGFEWKLEGGSAQFPGPDSQVYANIVTPSFNEIDGAYLPFDATEWNPAGDFSVAEEFIGGVRTSFESVDTNAFTVTNVRALATGSPSLDFGPSPVTYIAHRNATLIAGVPEPNTAILIAMASSSLILRRNRLSILSNTLSLQ